MLCKYCKVERPDDWFEVCRIVNGKEYHRLRCRRCKRACTNVRRTKLRTWLKGFKRTLQCMRCGFSDPRALQFHHQDRTEKVFTVADMVCSGLSTKSILREIQKCIVLCANCHCIEHAEEDDEDEDLAAAQTDRDADWASSV